MTQLTIERYELTDILNALEDGVYIFSEHHRIETTIPAKNLSITYPRCMV